MQSILLLYVLCEVDDQEAEMKLRSLNISLEFRLEGECARTQVKCRPLTSLSFTVVISASGLLCVDEYCMQVIPKTGYARSMSAALEVKSKKLPGGEQILSLPHARRQPAGGRALGEQCSSDGNVD